MSDHAPKDSPGTKHCKACDSMVPVENFYRDSRTASGLNCYCKPCAKAKSRRYQHANREKVLAKKKVYYQQPGKHELNYANHLKSRARHPERYAARQKVGVAIKHGKLVRQPCKTCGAPKANAHHHDYNKPLDVEWLCTRCHGIEHRTSPEGLAAAGRAMAAVIVPPKPRREPAEPIGRDIPLSEFKPIRRAQ